MKISLKIIIFSTFVIFNCVFAGARETLRIAVDDDFPPFSFAENGKTVGIDVDIVQELGKRLEIDFKISLMPWKRVLIMTRKGAYEGSMSLFKTIDREQYAIFTHPIHYSTFVLFVKKGSEFDFTSIEDLYGKKIIKQAGFSIGGKFGSAVNEKKIIIQEAFEFEDFFISLIKGNSDALVNNLDVTLYELKNQPSFKKYIDKISYLPKPIENRRGAYFVLSKNSKIKNKLSLAKRITKNLQNMEFDGTFLKITSKYIKNYDYRAIK